MKLWQGGVTAILMLGIGALTYASFSQQTELVLHANNTPTLPTNFIEDTQSKSIGSKQFSVEQLKFIQKRIKAPFVIVDLRKDSHVFVDGYPVSWMKKTMAGLQPLSFSNRQLQDLINSAENQGVVQAYKVQENMTGAVVNKAHVPLPMTGVFSEAQIAKQLYIPYIQFSIAKDALPNRETIEELITLATHIPKDTWVYFHGGEDIRTTSLFMTLYAILHSTRHHSLKALLKHLQKKDEGRYDFEFNLRDMAFIENFYNRFNQQSNQELT